MIYFIFVLNEILPVKMRNIFIIALILSYSISFSQDKILHAILIEHGSTDSIEVGLRVNVNLFDKTLLRESSFNYKPKIAELNGEKLPKDDWVKAKDYDYLIFTDFKGKRRVFATQHIVKEFKMIDSLNIRFIEQLYLGNINWLRDFSRNGYDGS